MLPALSYRIVARDYLHDHLKYTVYIFFYEKSQKGIIRPLFPEQS